MNKSMQNKMSLSNYAQWGRQFNLIKQANLNCLTNFPNDFHHKIKMKKESESLSTGLKQGRELLAELSQTAPLTEAQRAKYKAFKRSANFLVKHLDDVIKDIESLEQGGKNE